MHSQRTQGCLVWGGHCLVSERLSRKGTAFRSRLSTSDRRKKDTKALTWNVALTSAGIWEASATPDGNHVRRPSLHAKQNGAAFNAKTDAVETRLRANARRRDKSGDKDEPLEEKRPVDVKRMTREGVPRFFEAFRIHEPRIPLHTVIEAL